MCSQADSNSWSSCLPLLQQILLVCTTTTGYRNKGFIFPCLAAVAADENPLWTTKISGANEEHAHQPSRGMASFRTGTNCSYHYTEEIVRAWCLWNLVSGGDGGVIPGLSHLAFNRGDSTWSECPTLPFHPLPMYQCPRKWLSSWDGVKQEGLEETLQWEMLKRRSMPSSQNDKHSPRQSIRKCIWA